MTPEQAQFTLDGLLPQVHSEWAITKKVLLAVPDTNLDYRPDPVSKTAPEIAWHILASEIWFYEGLISGEFPMEENPKPEGVESVADMVAWYEGKAPGLIEKIQEIPAEKLAKTISFFGLFENAAVTYLTFMLNHSIHHRGQISSYLRAMGGKVPSIYGGSADEPFEAPSR